MGTGVDVVIGNVVVVDAVVVVVDGMVVVVVVDVVVGGVVVDVVVEVVVEGGVVDVVVVDVDVVVSSPSPGHLGGILPGPFKFLLIALVSVNAPPPQEPSKSSWSIDHTKAPPRPIAFIYSV